MRPNSHIALIYHYDLARALNGEPVDWQAIPVNVDAGREGGDLCRAAADFAKRRDLFAMPAPSVPSAPACPPDETQTSEAGQTGEVASGNGVGEIPRRSSPPHDATSSAFDRDRLRARIAGLIDQAPRVEAMLRRHWPTDIAPLSKPGHTDDELAQILVAVRRVETEVGAPWHPDDGPPPHSRIAIERALKAWEGRDAGTAWFAASLIATFEQCRNADSTFEELVAQFTIEQCERLRLAAQSQ